MTTSWQAKDDGWRVMVRRQQSKNGGKNEWHDIEYQGEMAKALSCPERTMKTPTPQQSSLSSRDEEKKVGRRRRHVASEETARGVLRYLEDSEDPKVSVTELREHLGMSEEAGISIKQVAQQARNENGQNIFENFQARRRRGMHGQLGQMERPVLLVWWSWKKGVIF